MGISGLLQYLKGFVQTIHISDLKGMRVAVDVSAWLYRGRFGILFLFV